MIIMHSVNARLNTQEYCFYVDRVHDHYSAHRNCSLHGMVQSHGRWSICSDHLLVRLVAVTVAIIFPDFSSYLCVFRSSDAVYLLSGLTNTILFSCTRKILPPRSIIPKFLISNPRPMSSQTTIASFNGGVDPYYPHPHSGAEYADSVSESSTRVSAYSAEKGYANVDLNLVAKDLDLEKNKFDSDAEEVTIPVHSDSGSRNLERNPGFKVERGGLEHDVEDSAIPGWETDLKEVDSVDCYEKARSPLGSTSRPKETRPGVPRF